MRIFMNDYFLFLHSRVKYYRWNSTKKIWENIQIPIPQILLQSMLLGSDVGGSGRRISIRWGVWLCCLAVVFIIRLLCFGYQYLIFTWFHAPRGERVVDMGFVMGVFSFYFVDLWSTKFKHHKNIILIVFIYCTLGCLITCPYYVPLGGCSYL